MLVFQPSTFVARTSTVANCQFDTRTGSKQMFDLAAPYRESEGGRTDIQLSHSVNIVHIKARLNLRGILYYPNPYPRIQHSVRLADFNWRRSIGKFSNDVVTRLFTVITLEERDCRIIARGLE